MPKLIKALGLTVLLLCPTISAWSQAENSPPSKAILVHAEVIEIKEDDNGVLCTLKVTHVYCGPDNLLGRTFLAHSGNVHDIHGWSILPVLKSGEAGIWILKVSSEVGLMRVMWSGLFPGVRSPTREHVSPRYKQAKALAEAVEHVCKKAAHQESSELLKKYALSEIYEISAWAIRATGELKPEGFLEFLHSLVPNNQIPIESQVELDKVLSELEEKNWYESKERLALLQRWVSAEMEEEEANTAFSRLDNTALHGEIDDKTLLGFAKTLVSNQGLSVDLRRWWCCRFAREIVERGNEEREGFEFLISLVKEGSEEEIRIAAAYTVSSLITPNSERIPAVKALLPEVKDPEAVGALRSALEHCGVQLHPLEPPLGEANNHVLPGLIVGAVVLAGVVVFLLLRRKGMRA
jgi:hypothetical protein